ncbi:MAG: DUF1778 domain-containing protein [Actinobacteria bacterium]|nr:DUF1778 domain-containing protein [Actinomycetota bacterium]
MAERGVTKTERLGLRTTERQHALLQAASAAEGTSMTEFVLRHATRAAEELLADRRTFLLGDAQWEAFMAALARPAKERPALKKLLQAPTILDAD